MLVITIKQPYAELICVGIMDVINVSFRKFTPGTILIHSSNISDNQTIPTLEQQIAIGNRKFEFNEGAIIGEAEIVACVENHSSIWAKTGYFQWIVKNPVLYKSPILNVKGKGGLWELNKEKYYKNF